MKKFVLFFLLLAGAAIADQPLSIIDTNTGNYVNFNAAGSTLTIPLAPTSVTSGNCAQFNSASGSLGQASGPCGAGTVSSFSAGALSPLFTTSVATTTSTPALSFSLSAQSAKLFLAGPASGGAAAPIFRQPACADLSDSASGCSSAAGSGAVQMISFQPGLITAVTATKGVFSKFVKASTVDNIEASAVTFTCVGNPTITLYECGTSSTCAAPTAIGSATVTTSGQAFDGTISAGSISAGDYVAFSISSGTCTSLDISATAQVHAN